MQRFRILYPAAVSAATLIIILVSPIVAGDTVFTALDLTTVSLSSATGYDNDELAPTFGVRGVEPSPFILWREVSTNRYYAWLMTLNSQTGAQLGQRALISFTGQDEPAAILWSKHFLSIPTRGVEPSPFVVFRNYLFQYHLVTFNFDGTPVLGSLHSQLLAIDPAIHGHPTCMTEMPGTAFSDGYPRLCIGTDTGYLILLINTFVAGIVVDEIIRPTVEPISDLEPIPQSGYISLGVLAGRTIYGYKFIADPAKSGGHRYVQVYTIEDPRPDYAVDFDVFGAPDEPLPGPDFVVALVLANSAAEVALANISAEQSGGGTLDPMIELHSNPIKAVAAGSLLMLLTDGSGVRYDPSYSPETGSSGCDIDVTDDIDDDCAVVCGDASGDRQVNVGDAVFIISYVFKSGSAPDPICAGDANGDSDTNVGDAVYLINYVFKSGPPPAEGCCP